jgi:hypothetical protein
MFYRIIAMGLNYEERMVARYGPDASGLCVDTASVTDGAHPYETGVEHPDFDEGRWIIVEAYDTREDALAGHDRWVAIMTADVLPDVLVDCANSEIAGYLDPTQLTHNRVPA